MLILVLVLVLILVLENPDLSQLIKWNKTVAALLSTPHNMPTTIEYEDEDEKRFPNLVPLAVASYVFRLAL